MSHTSVQPHAVSTATTKPHALQLYFVPFFIADLVALGAAFFAADFAAGFAAAFFATASFGFAAGFLMVFAFVLASAFFGAAFFTVVFVAIVIPPFWFFLNTLFIVYE
jgi:hypothetical protein